MSEDLVNKFLGKLDGHGSGRQLTKTDSQQRDRQTQPQIAFSSHWSCLLDETMVDSSETDWLRSFKKKNIQHVKKLKFKQLIF
jgi:hypothetical protein